MKKFISMALALMMTLSLCAVVAAPKADAGFTDANDLSSQYAEQAADVIQKIEVMDGYDDGSFRPAAGLTRQAAAKIICNMILGPTTARALPTNANPFPDVLAGNQFAGYISYCEQQGIISGYADGTFRGGDPLSGYAYLKMLLGALGYDARHEGFVGDNWKVNVAKIALGIGLNKGIVEDLDGATQVTREAAAIYAFNTLQADMVEYESKNTIEINGVQVSMGGGNAVPQTWGTSATAANHISAATDNGAIGGRPIVQFAERYFDKLEREPNGDHSATGDPPTNGKDEYTQDNFGRPSVIWKWKGVDIGTYSRDPDAVFVGGVKVNAIYEALNMSSGDGGACLYINSADANNKALDVSRGNDKDLDHANNLLMYRSDDVGKTIATVRAEHGLTGGSTTTKVKDTDVGNSLGYYGDGNHRVDRIGDGALIECFRNEANNHVDVCVISVYGGKIDAVKGPTSKKDAYVTISYANDNQAAHRPDGIDDKSDRAEYETEDFDEEEVIAYTYSDSDNSIQDMFHTSSDSGALTSRVSGKNLRLDNTVYAYAKEHAFDDMTENDLSSKSSYVVYSFSWSSVPGFEDAGDDELVIWIEEDEFAVDQYVLIERINIEDKNGNELKYPAGASVSAVTARVRTSSGVARNYSLDDSKNYRNDAGTDVAAAFMPGNIVRLSNNSNGYRLHALADKYTFWKSDFRINGKTIKTNGKDIYTPVIYDEDHNPVGGNIKLVVDSDTHFVVEDTANDTYKAYVGTKNVPEVKGPKGDEDTTGATAYIYHRDGVAKLIFIASKDTTSVSSSSKDVMFLLAPSTSDLVDSDDGYYYDVLAIDKDEVVTLRVKRGTIFNATGSYFVPGSNIKNTKNEGNCVILNKITYDSNDLVIEGSFDSSKVDYGRAIGIRRSSSTEVKLNTYYTATVYDVADNVRVFYADDSDNLEEIDYDDIINDNKSAVYYVIDDDVITYLFIVKYDDDGIPTAAEEPDKDAHPIDLSKVEGFDLVISDESKTSVKSGATLHFQVLSIEEDPHAYTPDEVTVSFEYVNAEGARREVVLDSEANYDADSGEWMAYIPEAENMREGSSITFYVDLAD